jgi:vacuolar protein sorting-associated protein 18
MANWYGPIFYWMTMSCESFFLGSGVYHGSIALPPVSDALVDSPSLLPYPPPPVSPPSSNSAVPISICLTEFHFILLYKDRVCAVGNLDEKLIWEEALPLVSCTGARLAYH